MKFLVLGVTGMAGHVIAIYLKEQGHDVCGFARRKVSFVKCIEGDARNEKLLREIIISGNYDAIINCIGVLNQFAEANKSDAVYLNSFLPHLLVKMTSDTRTKVIHMSTDCVFSGKTGGYNELSLCDGESFYDRSKALGEIKDDKNITFRNSVVGPDINEEGIGLLNWFMKQKGAINGFTRAIWTGITTLELAKVIEAAMKEKAVGLYNMVNNEPISKYDLLVLFNHYLKKDEIEIIPSESVILNKSLIRTNYDFSYQIPDYEIMVMDMVKWMKKHRELYPNYNL